LKFQWDRPVIVFYKERMEQPERSAFLVVKAMKLIISSTNQSTSLKGSIQGFFPLMGNIDYVSSKEGTSDRYVLCWFDDGEEDFSRSWRRLTGVTFPKWTCSGEDKAGKISHSADFKAKEGKFE